MTSAWRVFRVGAPRVRRRRVSSAARIPPPVSLSARWAITPLFLSLILVAITDLGFAVDSIPDIFAITPDPFIVFTSNIFAILGLRALYFCLAALIQKFRFLKPALILILAFVGVKLLLLSVPPYLDVIGMDKADPIKIDTTVSLLVVVGTLALATVLSVGLPWEPSTAGARGLIDKLRASQPWTSCSSSRTRSRRCGLRWARCSP